MTQKNVDDQKKIQDEIDRLIDWLEDKPDPAPARPAWGQMDPKDDKTVAENVVQDVIWLVGPGGFRNYTDTVLGAISPPMMVWGRDIRAAYRSGNKVIFVDKDFKTLGLYVAGSIFWINRHLNAVREYTNTVLIQ